MKFNMARNWNRFEKSYSGKDVVDGDGTLLVVGRPLNGLYVCGRMVRKIWKRTGMLMNYPYAIM
mgnify:CR=1 FL=1